MNPSYRLNAVDALCSIHKPLEVLLFARMQHINFWYILFGIITIFAHLSLVCVPVEKKEKPEAEQQTRSSDQL